MKLKDELKSRTPVQQERIDFIHDYRTYKRASPRIVVTQLPWSCATNEYFALNEPYRYTAAMTAAQGVRCLEQAKEHPGDIVASMGLNLLHRSGHLGSLYADKLLRDVIRSWETKPESRNAVIELRKAYLDSMNKG